MRIAHEIMFYIFKVCPYSPYSSFTNSSMEAGEVDVIIPIHNPYFITIKIEAQRGKEAQGHVVQ